MWHRPLFAITRANTLRIAWPTFCDKPTRILKAQIFGGSLTSLNSFINSALSPLLCKHFVVAICKLHTFHSQDMRTDCRCGASTGSRARLPANCYQTLVWNDSGQRLTPRNNVARTCSFNTVKMNFNWSQLKLMSVSARHLSSLSGCLVKLEM